MKDIMIIDQASMPSTAIEDLQHLSQQIKDWGMALGFQQVGISHTDLTTAEQRLQTWLDKGYHGEMHYMASHGLKRSRPALLQENTRSIISVRMDYLAEGVADSQLCLDTPEHAFVSRYALGRDYHKVLRNRLQKLAERIQDTIGPFGYRAFVDSAPVLEKAIAEQAGLGWIGKHSNLINRKAGSWFFLGELYTDLPLAIDTPANNHCGSCQSCMDLCPTQAIVAPYQVDARLCISYLTIEFAGSIPEQLRPLIGNRIYGCDDCLLACPWNRFAHFSREPDFQPRHQLDNTTLLKLFAWTEKQFLLNTEGSAIRRIGFSRWQRNIAIALGNGPAHSDSIRLLEQRLPESDDLLAEHIHWALQQLKARACAQQKNKFSNHAE